MRNRTEYPSEMSYSRTESPGRYPWIPFQSLLKAIPRTALTPCHFCAALACGWANSQAWKKLSSREAGIQSGELSMVYLKLFTMSTGHIQRWALGSRVRASRKSTRAAFYSAFALLLDSQSKVVIITLLLDVTEKEKYSPEASSPVTDGFQCIEMNRYSGLLHWLWELIQCFCSWDLYSLLACWQFMFLSQ